MKLCTVPEADKRLQGLALLDEWQRSRVYKAEGGGKPVIELFTYSQHPCLVNLLSFTFVLLDKRSLICMCSSISVCTTRSTSNVYGYNKLFAFIFPSNSYIIDFCSFERNELEHKWYHTLAHQTALSLSILLMLYGCHRNVNLQSREEVLAEHICVHFILFRNLSLCYSAVLQMQMYVRMQWYILFDPYIILYNLYYCSAKDSNYRPPIIWLETTIKFT